MAQDKTVRVLIDAHMLGSGETGNETYIANLLPNLAGFSGMEFAAAVARQSEIPTSLSNSGLQIFPLHPSSNWMRLLVALPRLCRRWRADLLHVTYIGPLYISCPFVATVHDVSFKRYPEFFAPRDRFLFATLLPLTLRRASAVITVSEHAKKEILNIYPFLEGRVHVTYEAPGASFRPLGEGKSHQAIRERYGIRARFILAVGNLQPRKNLLRLVRAFGSIRRQIGSLQLVIVGQAQWQASELFAEVERLGLQQDVVFTGYVSTEELVQLYNDAQVFVYPSIYEGFGLPVIEAMACGTPVVTANTSSLPEVAGDAALLINPLDEQDIAQAIHQVVTDKDLAQSLAEKGKRQANQFSWHKTAEETVKVYKQIADQHYAQG